MQNLRENQEWIIERDWESMSWCEADQGTPNTAWLMSPSPALVSSWYGVLRSGILHVAIVPRMTRHTRAEMNLLRQPRNLLHEYKRGHVLA